MPKGPLKRYFSTELGRFIHQYRIDHRLTQKKLEEALGITAPQYVSKVETGAIIQPNDEFFKNFSGLSGKAEQELREMATRQVQIGKPAQTNFLFQAKIDLHETNEILRQCLNDRFQTHEKKAHESIDAKLDSRGDLELTQDQEDLLHEARAHYVLKDLTGQEKNLPSLSAEGCAQLATAYEMIGIRKHQAKYYAAQDAKALDNLIASVQMIEGMSTAGRKNTQPLRD